MKNKLFVCFRPAVVETEDGKPDGGRDPGSTYIAVVKKQSSKKTPTDNENVKIKGPPHRSKSFSRVLKSVLFEASLREEARTRNVCKLTFRSKSDGSRKRDKYLDDKPMNPQSTEAEVKQPRSCSTVTTSSSSSSISSSISEQKHSRPPLPKSKSLSRSKSLSLSLSKSFHQRKQSIPDDDDKRIGGGCSSSSNSNLGLYLILITLCVTIFWGRICAVVFTLTWLYFLPGRTDIDRRPENAKKLPEMEELREYRKRVIMEGLLERSHHRDSIKILT